ncbi:hypothetical protein MSAN_01019600 [Mycena sanguinolenta]|uniref:Monopolin complex subunit Csm1/Pcs1 C-terminal domain-containing protein n=1 Tax=Mycena sanguinolenta TaxID=230812 RepID=A0A8H7D6X1_9AGAR|nr:hypothetical protein MSAN_01019600 [Mycena sanguinolenta]
MSDAGSERVSRSRAGPSKPTSKSRQKQAKEVVAVEEEESDDFAEVAQPEEEVMEVDPPPTRKPPSRSTAKSGAKGKGKVKTESASTKQQPSRAEVEVIDDDDDDAGAPATARAINNATNHNGAIGIAAPSRRVASSAAATKQIESLRRQLESAQANIKELSKQLEESYRVRHTEPELLQQRQMEKYEETIRTKELLIKQHEEMLARKEPLSRDGKTSVLHLVTRETADAEKHSAEEKVAYWQAQFEERGRLLEEKERKIAELTQIQKDLQYEIKIERENSQKAPRNPPSAPRGRGPNGVLGSDDPKHSELVKFYEDVTNLLVMDIKIQESKYLKLDECALTCLYTYVDKTGSPESRRSLAFSLRFTYDPLDPDAPVESKDDLDQAAQYTPIDVDKEGPEFNEALQFLNNGFTFPRKQLPLFFNSLVTNMKSACEPESASEFEGENDSMQDVQLVE